MQTLTHTKARLTKMVAALGLAVAIFGGADNAVAGTVYMNTYQAAGADASQLKVRLRAVDKGNSWMFEFKNLSSIESSLTGIFFEKDLKTDKLINKGRLTGMSSDAGVKFNARSNGTPVDAGSIDWEGTGLAFVANNYTHGLNAGSGEGFKFYIDKRGNTNTILNLLSIFTDMGSRIAVTLAGLPNGDGGLMSRIVLQETTDPIIPGDNNPGPDQGGNQNPNLNPVHAPSPAAFGAGLAILAGGLLRRRTR